MRLKRFAMVYSSLCLSICLHSVEYPVVSDVPIDTFTVTDNVINNKARKIGLDYWPGAYAHFLPANLNNLWNRFGAFEPRLQVNWGPVEQGGAHTFVCDKGWGLSGWNKWLSGFWDGAEVHVFGLKNGQFELKRVGIIETSILGPDVVDTYTLKDDGGVALEVGDWVYVRQTGYKPSPHQAVTTPKGKAIKKNGIDYFARQANMLGNPTWELVKDPCPEAGSRAAMKLTMKEASGGGFYEYHTGGTTAGFSQWPEGDFHWEGWLKRSATGQVTIDLGSGTVSKTFDVGTTWKKYSFNFNPADAFRNYTAKTSQYAISVPDACELYLDNIMITQVGVKPFATYPDIIEKMKEFKPGMIRQCGMIGTRTMDVLLSKGINQLQEQDTTRGNITSMMGTANNLIDTLGLCKDISSNPWIVTPGMMTLDDCDHLMEYLGASSNTGYGKKRSFYGQDNPWVDVFDTIYIELGNEQWGANFSHCFNSSPEIYGRLADMYFRRMKASPYYKAGQFVFVCNGWSRSNRRNGWSDRVARSCPNADVIDNAFYFGGWDGVTLKGEDNSDLFQNRMFYTPHIVEKDLSQQLCSDPELGPRMATILLEDSALQKIVLPYLKNVGQGRSLDKSCQSIVSAIMTEPVIAINQDLFKRSKVAKTLVKNAFGIAPEEEVNFKIESLFQNNYKPLNAFIQQYPKQVIDFATTHKLSPSVHASIAALVAGKEPERLWQAFHGVTPVLKTIILPEFKNNEQLIVDVGQSVSQLNLFELKGRLLAQTGSILDISIVTVTEVLFQRIQENPAAELAAIATDPTVYIDEAQLVVADLIKALEMTVLNYQTEELSLDKFDNTNRIKVLSSLEALLRKDQLCLDKGALALVCETISALKSGVTTSLKELSNDDVLLQDIRKRIVNAFADKVTTSILGDSLIAEKIFKKYDVYPKDPENGNKMSANYEAGPGYMLPAPNKPVPEEAEEFGKSLALAVTTIDAFMHEFERKFDFQCFFRFAFGTRWSSHNNNTDWFRHPCYEALLMVNEYCDGDLVYVEPTEIKRVDIPRMKSSHIDNHGKAHHREIDGRKNVPLVKCYVFKEDKKRSFVLYNRSYRESRQVQLKLPYGPSSQAVFYRLSAETPTATNRTSLNVIQKKTIIDDFADGYEMTLGPADILIITNEGL